MNIFYLEDIRKSFYLLNLYYETYKNDCDRNVFVFNEKIDNWVMYLIDFKNAFPDIVIYSIHEFSELNIFDVHIVYTNLTIHNNIEIGRAHV